MSKRVGAWYRAEDGEWRHAPWFKVAINAVLRFFQTRKRPARLFVLATRCTKEGDPPRVLGYQFQRVRHLPERG